MLLACTIYSLHCYTMTYKGTFFTAWPTILTLPAPTTHREGDRFELVCSFTGVPAPEIHWEKDGSVFLLGGGGRRVINSTGRSQLEINSLALSDAGAYSCSVSNVAGTARNNVRLEVERGELNAPNLDLSATSNGSYALSDSKSHDSSSVILYSS